MKCLQAEFPVVAFKAPTQNNTNKVVGEHILFVSEAVENKVKGPALANAEIQCKNLSWYHLLTG